MARRWLPWITMAVVVVVALTVGLSRDNGPRSNQDRVDSLARQFKCLVCAGESVFESRSDFANQLRKSISEDVAAGRSDQEIRTAVVGEYQEEVLLKPQATGANLLLWILPILAAMSAVAGLGLAFANWRRLGSVRPSAEDRALVAAAMAADDGSSAEE
ncbi:MAG: ccmH [Acidimicrobiia bacterium]|nr:ccmH [Acidimicrobiia bacterium]